METMGFIEVCFIFSPIILIIIFGILGSRKAKEKENKNKQNYINRMKRFHSNENNNNNNRHSYINQDVEQEIIKVDHTFSKEVFLNNAKEVFFKYHNSMAKGNCEELRKYLTENFFNNMQNRINEKNEKSIKVITDNIYIYNAFLYEFSKSTERQVITVKITAEMKNYEINKQTQFVTEGNKYAKTKFDYQMQFERKTKDVKCQNCGAPANTKDLSVCGYCNTPIEVENNEWKLNYINILKD